MNITSVSWLVVGLQTAKILKVKVDKTQVKTGMFDSFQLENLSSLKFSLVK